MLNQRIYYVPPRMVGKFADWSGLNLKAGQSWLIDHVADLGFNAIWFSPMCQTTEVTKNIHGKNLTGSYYATRNHFKYDDDYSSGHTASDLAHMRHFCKKAGEKNIRIYADLPFNHVAADHPLVIEENKSIEHILKKYSSIIPVYGHKNKVIGLKYSVGLQEKEFYFKFRRNDDYSIRICGPAEDPWSDVAQINYSSPEARRFFIEESGGQKGYFKQVIDWYLDQGITGFRCDAAYLVPPESWQDLISYAKSKNNDLVFMAETLGGPENDIERLAEARIPTPDKKSTRPAFDLGMLGVFWWDLQSDNLPVHEHQRMLRVSHFGGAGSPDTHDTATTLAAALRNIFNGASDKKTDADIALASIRNYAFTVLACPSNYMQMGFEFCNEKQNHVFRGQVTPNDWKNLKARAGTELDITKAISDINKIKAEHDFDHCRVNFSERKVLKDGGALQYTCEYIDADTGIKKGEITLFINKKPENGEIYIDVKTKIKSIAAYAKAKKKLKL